jgi:phosphate transport system protein
MTPTHVHFDQDLRALKEKLLHMGATALDMVDKSARSLAERNADLAREVFELENSVNHLHVEVDDCCVKLLALHQPMAGDLRFLAAAMKINADLERIADQAVNVAQTCHDFLLKEAPVPQADIILTMADVSRRMIRDALRAFDTKDVELARDVMALDEQEDRLKREAVTNLITLIHKDPSHSTQFVDLILLSKNFERVGDHATNIAEDVIFMTLGKDVRHHLAEDFILTPVRNPPAA